MRGHTIDWLMQRGHDAIVNDAPTTWLGNRVFLTPHSTRGGLVGRLLSNFLGVLGDLAILPLAFKGRYDIIQVRDKFFAGIIAWLAARLTGAKFVYWMSYPFPESKLYEARLRLVTHPHFVFVKWYIAYAVLYGLVLRVADHVFVQSARMKDDVAAKGVARCKMTAIPIGHGDDAKILNTTAPILMHLGVIQKIRHSDMLVRALGLVRRRYPGATLVYVGEGQQQADRQVVESEAARLGLGNAVTVTGFLPMETAWEYVKRADICFSPYYPIPVLLSTSPTKLIEYMAMAKCIVANEHPEQCWVMEESGVGRCIPWSEQDFAEEVCRLLDDPEAARTAAARGPDWVRAHRTYDVIADQVEACYAALLAPRA